MNLSIEDFYKAKAALEKANVLPPYFVIEPEEILVNKFAFKKVKPVELVDCPKAQPPWPTTSLCVKEEGNKPMRYNDNYASATANVQTPKSDLATSRDYFTKRLQEVRYPKRIEFEGLFNLHVNNQPKSFADLIARIKGGKYTIDPKIEKKFNALDDQKEWYHGYDYGIIWEGPKTDYTGYEKALNDLEKQETAARDAIMAAATAGDMKAAVEAFEAWTPVVKND